MKVIPQRLLDMQFEWETPDIDSALLFTAWKRGQMDDEHIVMYLLLAQVSLA